MTSPTPVVNIEVRVPLATTERAFLQLAVQAAARRFREMQGQSLSAFQPPAAETLATSRQAG
jgi:hypothetical protein